MPKHLISQCVMPNTWCCRLGPYFRWRLFVLVSIPDAKYTYEHAYYYTLLYETNQYIVL